MNAVDPTAVVSSGEQSPLTAELEPPLYVPATPLTEATLCVWIATALPGERLQIIALTGIDVHTSMILRISLPRA